MLDLCIPSMVEQPLSMSPLKVSVEEDVFRSEGGIVEGGREGWKETPLDQGPLVDSTEEVQLPTPDGDASETMERGPAPPGTFVV